MNRACTLLEAPMPGLFLGGQLAIVKSLDDPETQNRVEIQLLSADGIADHDGPVWARVAAPFAGKDRGAFLLPDVGDEVFIVFVHGDPRLPVIVGGLWNGDATSPETIRGGNNRKKVLRSKNGVKVTLDDQEGLETFIAETPGGQKLTLKDGPGSVNIEDSNGNSITLEAAGITLNTSATLTINASQIKVSSGMITADTAIATFSTAIKCEALTATTVVSKTYTPGAGNVW